MKTLVVGNASLEVKRLYLPVEFEVKCPECGHVQTIDYDSNYLSYPNVGSDGLMYWCCNDCDTEHEYKIKLNMSIDVDCKDLVEGA